MNNHLNKELYSKLQTIKKEATEYEDLDDSKKVDESMKIKDNIKKCKKITNEYISMIDNPHHYLDIDAEDINNIASYEECMKIIKDTQNKINNSKTIDEKVLLYLELMKYISWCEDYLKNRESISITKI